MMAAAQVKLMTQYTYNELLSGADIICFHFSTYEINIYS
ncbi:hypothetical protein yberc0001_33610 [Yersinia bercovieri ATCC 43970]|uniref:Uncharacterized protein n=1 Tax=Yersinia bercovieri ATCC 43970 TaxID=349968 RepID=A0ABP2E3U4_YERBE|nr:hypothetical protein yberc0001_33610 [Yersinia bercovieri ATCC 43970]